MSLHHYVVISSNERGSRRTLMSDQKPKAPFVLSQLEEALEERQRPDRRQAQKPVADDRRKGDRRSQAK